MRNTKQCVRGSLKYFNLKYNIYKIKIPHQKKKKKKKKNGVRG